MNDRKIKHSDRALSRLLSYVTILGTILGLLFTWAQLRQAKAAETRELRAQPLSYHLEAVNTHYQYEVSWEAGSFLTPAPSLRLTVEHGALHSVTAITFDGTSFGEIATLPTRDSWSGSVVDITLPPQAAFHQNDLVYDFFFLYLEPVKGPAVLDLVCNTVSLSSHQVQTQLFHRIALLELDASPEGPRRAMLTCYSDLVSRMEQLGLLAL